MDANLRRRFSDERSFGSQTHLPRDRESCRSISAVRRTQSQPFLCGSCISRGQQHREKPRAWYQFARNDFADRASIGHRKPGRPGKKNRKKSILTSVLVAVALRIEW